MVKIVVIVIEASMKTECDNLYGWVENGHINLIKNGEAQRYNWERRRRK